jgi:GDP-L-fucose synthase
MKRHFRRILITGGTGFLGHHIAAAVQAAYPDGDILAVGSREADLRRPGEPDRLVRETRPDGVVHLAARCGGVLANRERPADFFYENIVMNTHMMEASFRHGVKKYLTLMGGCAYPAAAVSPLGEDQLWNGFPYEGSAGYAMAKKMNLVQSWAYRAQHGFNSVVLIPGNVYGEWDNFHARDGHVIPALLRRATEAKERNAPSIEAWGSGRPTRDFVYAGDVAALIPWFLENYDSSDPVNLSSGARISIRELTETVCRVVGYAGEIVWDASKPDGQMDKIFDVSRLRGLGLSCPTPLEEGLRRTAAWFLEARRDGTVRL